MTLMPVSKSSVLVERSRSSGGSRWIGQYSSASTGPRPSTGSPSDVEDAAERGFADGDLDRAAGVDAILAADQAVGAAEGDAADAAAAEVLLHFAGEIDLHALVLGDDL